MVMASSPFILPSARLVMKLPIIMTKSKTKVAIIAPVTARDASRSLASLGISGAGIVSILFLLR